MKIIQCFLLVLITTLPSLAQKEVPTEILDRFRAIYEENSFAAKSFQADWLPDGSAYLVRESSENNQQSLVSYDPESGRRTVLINSSKLRPENSKNRVFIQDYSFSPDGKRMLITSREQVEGDHKIAYWLFDLKSGHLEQVQAGQNASISPNGQKILFTKQGNLLVYDKQTGQTQNLTDNAVPGSLSYNSGVWSPDSKKIAFVQSDVSRIRKRSMLIPSDPSYPGVREMRFARVGETIATLKIGVVDSDGREIRWLPVPIPKEGLYLGDVSWAGNSTELMVERLSRFRDHREVFLINTDNGTISTIFEESDPAWVVASYRTNIGVDWINDYSSFLILSEKDAWRNLYKISRDGKQQENLTPGAYDIIDRASIDESNNWFYFYASPDNGTQSYLYRIPLSGSQKPKRITPKNQPGIHHYQFSPDSKWAIHTWSSANRPPVKELVQLPNHKVIRVFEDNKELVEKAKGWQPVEFFQVEIENEIEIDGWMIKPQDFDPSKKYPVFIYVYGEPHGQTVKDAWGSAMAHYHRAIADLGYIVISMDNRGTPSPKGAAWRRAIAGSLGPLSTEEQAAALKAFGSTRSWVDLSRVGIWGWSGGGSNTLNALFRKPNDYHLGIAVVPKPIPRLYNAWFQEIYMNTPEVNPDGYRKSAPINFAEGLEGDLLIITGTGETNTHVQIVEGLVDRLIELGKQFDFMAYPNRNHGLSEGKGTSFHLRAYMARYLINHLEQGGK